MIDRLISEGAAATGLNEAQVRLALAGALGLLRKHAALDRLDALYAAVPGAQALADSPDAQVRGGGGLFGGLMKSAGGLSGAAMADAMGMLDKAQRAGVGKPQLRALLAVAQDQIRAAGRGEVLGDAIESIPGVGALLKR